MAAPLQIYFEPRSDAEIRERLTHFKAVCEDHMEMVEDLYYDGINKLQNEGKISADELPTLDELYYVLNNEMNCGKDMDRTERNIFTALTCMCEFEILVNSEEFAKIWWGYVDENYGFESVIKSTDIPQESVNSDVNFINADGIEYVVKTAKIRHLQKFIKHNGTREYFDDRVYDASIRSRFMLLIHEIFINLIGINSTSLPNVVKLVRVCTIQDKYSPYFLLPVIIQEKAPGNSLGKIFNNINEKDFLEIFAQIFFTLWNCDFINNFIHFDLHCNNIMVERLDRAYPFEYYLEIDNEIRTITFNSEYIVKLIDYGTSSIMFENDIYGTYSLTNAFVCPDVENAFLGDLHKLLKISYSKHKTSQVAALVKKIFELIFPNEDITYSYNDSWSFPFYREPVITYFDIYKILFSDLIFKQLNIMII